MNEHNSNPPRLPIQLLKWFLPNNVKDEIIGDLHEEFTHSKDTRLAKVLRCWYQSFTAIGRYSMTTANLIKSVLMAFSLSVFLLLTVAVTFLSLSENMMIYSQSYWTNGQVHLLFFEPVFWQFFASVPEKITLDFTLQLFINFPAMIWTFSCLSLMFVLQKQNWFSKNAFMFAALVMIFTPYVYGVLTFQLVDIPLYKAGPLIAFMWLSIWYLVFPLSYLFIKRLNKPVSTAI